MNKRCFLLLCLFCTAFSQSALGMIMSLQSVVKNNKKVVLIEYDELFCEKGVAGIRNVGGGVKYISFDDEIRKMKAEKDFFPSPYDCDNTYFPVLRKIVERRHEVKRFTKKIDFFVASPSGVLLLPKRAAFSQALDNTYFADGLVNKKSSPFVFKKVLDIVFFELSLFNRHKYCKEMFICTKVSPEGILIKNDRELVIPTRCILHNPCNCNIFSKNPDMHVKRRMKNVFYYMNERKEIVNKLYSYCKRNRCEPSDRMENAIINTGNLMSLFDELKINRNYSWLNFFACISGCNIKFSNLPVNKYSKRVEMNNYSQEKYFRDVLTELNFLRTLSLTLDSQRKDDITFFVLPGGGVEKIYEELKYIGYEDDIKSNFIPKAWRPIPPMVFEIFLNRVLGCCNVCGKRKKKSCGICKATYCSEECQLKDWKKHKPLCLKLKEDREKEEAQKNLGKKYCNSCGKLAKKRCQRCTQAHYCSRECQKEDWSEHKKTCKK